MAVWKFRSVYIVKHRPFMYNKMCIFSEILRSEITVLMNQYNIVHLYAFSSMWAIIRGFSTGRPTIQLSSAYSTTIYVT